MVQMPLSPGSMYLAVTSVSKRPERKEQSRQVAANADITRCASRVRLFMVFWLLCLIALTLPFACSCGHSLATPPAPSILRLVPSLRNAAPVLSLKHSTLFVILEDQCELKPSLEGCASNQEGMNNFQQTSLYFMSRLCHVVGRKIHLRNWPSEAGRMAAAWQAPVWGPV